MLGPKLNTPHTHTWGLGLMLAMTLTLLLPSPATEAAGHCERSEGCKQCKYSWWYAQETCQLVERNAYCSCETEIETCLGETGECDYGGSSPDCRDLDNGHQACLDIPPG